MRILLDTHVVFCATMKPGLISAPARAAMESASYVAASAATAWEIATKVRLGKWEDARPFIAKYSEYISASGIDDLPVLSDHARHAGVLSGTNKDPFDRILVAQAELEGLRLVSADGNLKDFAIDIIW